MLTFSSAATLTVVAGAASGISLSSETTGLPNLTVVAKLAAP